MGEVREGVVSLSLSLAASPLHISAPRSVCQLATQSCIESRAQPRDLLQALLC